MARLFDPRRAAIFADRKVGVIEEDDRCPLGVGELSQRCQEIRIAVSVQVLARTAPRAVARATRLQRACRDPEGGAPRPGGRVTDGLAPIEELGEGFGHRVARDLRVTGERVDGAPEPFGVGPIHGLDALVRLQRDDCGVHH